MVFNSLTFCAFFAIVFFLHRLPFSWSWKKRNLWVLSYLFYAAWNPPFVVLLWISTLVDWYAGKGIYKAKTRGQKRVCLTLSLCTNLGMLSFFKYGGFLLENFSALCAFSGISYTPAKLNIILPVGISFYTFQSLSYTLDIYKSRMKPWSTFSDFALFVTFFPQLVAGPIVRASDFLPQTIEPRKADTNMVSWGCCLMLWGLFQKVWLADAILAPVCDAVFSNPLAAGQADAWVGALAFSGQIFFDFSGYSTIAIGTAMCLGFALPDNFRFPYAALGFSDFWRRWHITLSTWLRDYLYIPLGGNRKPGGRILINLMITMLLGGLWHGASWHFVVWGGLHGLYLILERGIRQAKNKLPIKFSKILKIPYILMTFFVVTVTWIFFRAADFFTAVKLVHTLFAGSSRSLVSGDAFWGVHLVVGLLLISHMALAQTSLEGAAKKIPWPAKVLIIAGIMTTLILAPSDERAFIYFQF